MGECTDKRNDPDFVSGQPATVTLLGYPDVCLPATLVALSGKNACLQIDRHLPVASPVKIEIDDALLLGEVVSSAPAAGGWVQIGVALEHVLEHTRQLAALAKRLLGETMPAEMEVANL